MPARIFCKVGELKGVDAEIGAAATLGRSSKATIQLRSGRISGEHLRIAYDAAAGCYQLEDLGSTNGTALDGVPVRGRERLGHLHVITLAGDYDLVFQDLELCARRHGAAPPGALAESEPDLHGTRIEQTPVALPAFLARQAEELADEEPDDRTRIDELPAVLPGILAFRPEETPPPEKPREAVTDDDVAKLLLGGEDKPEDEK